ncbi:tRNA (adenine(22)-N(1))-methyltransferase [Lactococcus raffinolactis]|uniref:tRNA (adenine(22)-N(1))-methyltransferase n=1 Tax=Pseudolactococcus raffinolactis TaxID=1366 RepID=UPI001436A88B|nr:tRNA (adenine(22)-N(1))-methyltransferase TrmK [Lactococcus raffinolactis]QIW51284.1 tRNA (adenine-N(1))-methyltransferase [Lactococcus raffinolactis]
MKNEKLSQRLTQVGEFVPQDAILLDVGSDHAYLPIHLVKTGRINKAIAGEVVKGPYESAVANVQSAGLQDQISVRLANGLAAFEPTTDGVNTITISGMGGHLIAEILEDGRDKLCQVSTMILQPNNGERHLRTWLQAHDFTISDEKILAENDKIYEIIVAHPGQSVDILTEAELCFGPFLLQEKSTVFLEKWASELAANQEILSKIPASAQQKQAEFSAKIAKIKEVLNVS